MLSINILKIKQVQKWHKDLQPIQTEWVKKLCLFLVEFILELCIRKVIISMCQCVSGNQYSVSTTVLALGCSNLYIGIIHKGLLLETVKTSAPHLQTNLILIDCRIFRRISSQFNHCWVNITVIADILCNILGSKDSVFSFFKPVIGKYHLHVLLQFLLESLIKSGPK